MFEGIFACLLIGDCAISKPEKIGNPWRLGSGVWGSAFVLLGVKKMLDVLSSNRHKWLLGLAKLQVSLTSFL